MAELTIEQLRRALVPPAAPPEERVAAFRAFVLEQPLTPPPSTPPSGGRGLFRWLRNNWLLLLAAVVAAIIAALTITYLLNVNPPAGFIRNVAHELGLPVDSQHLEDARDTADKLRAALAGGDQDRARVLGEQLTRQLAGLDSEERAKLKDADELIVRATKQQPPQGPGPPSSPGTGTATGPGPNTEIGTKVAPLDITRRPVTLVTSLAVRPDRTTAVVGETVSLAVRGLSAAGDDLGDMAGEVELGIAPNGTCTGSTCTSQTPGRHTITAKVGDARGAAVVTFVPGPVDRLDVTPPDPTATAGDSVAFTAHGFDRFNNPIGDVTGRSAFAITPDGTCAGRSCSATAAGPHTVTATHGGITGTASLVVVPLPPVRLVLAPPEVQTIVGVARTFTVRSADTFGNDTGDFTSAATLAVGPDGSCEANTCSAVVPGTHLVTARVGQLTGSATMDVFAGTLDHITVTPSRVTAVVGALQRFTVAGLDGADNRVLDLTPVARFRITPDGTCTENGCRAAAVGPHQVTVDADGKTATAVLDAVVGPTDRLVLTLTQPTATAGAPVRFTVTGLDAFGNTTGDLTGKAALSMTPDGSCTGGTCTATVAGPHTITVTIEGLTISTQVVVVPAATSRLALDPATATVPAGGAQRYNVQGLDAFGNRTGDVTSKAVLGVTPDGACQGQSCTAGQAGPHTVAASLDGATGTASLLVVPGAVQRLTVLASAIVTAGSSQPFTAQGSDGFGNPLGDLTDKALFSMGPDGECTNNSCRAVRVGDHSVVATVGDVKGSAAVQIVPADLSTIVVKPDSAQATAGQQRAFGVEGFDPFANPLGDLTSFAAFSIAPEGQCNNSLCGGTKAGAHTVTAAIGAIKGSSALLVVPGPTTHIGLTSDGILTAGKTLLFTVAGLDQFDNPVGDLTDKASFTITPDGECAQNACGATHAGPHTVTATVGTMKTSAPLTVVPAGLTGIRLTPDPGEVAAGERQAFTVEGLDQFGNVTGDLTKQASFSIASSGECEANECGATKAGVYTVTAVLGDLKATAEMHVVAATLDRLEISPEQLSVYAYDYVTYTVHGFDRFGNALGDLTETAEFSIKPNGECNENVCSARKSGLHFVEAEIGAVDTYASLFINCKGEAYKSQQLSTTYTTDPPPPQNCPCVASISQSAPTHDASTNSVCIPSSSQPAVLEERHVSGFLGQLRTIWGWVVRY